MRHDQTRTLHSQACACRRCALNVPANRRLNGALRAATRVLILLAVLASIPFIVAHALASARGDKR